MEEGKFAIITQRDGNRNDLTDLGQGRRFPAQGSKEIIKLRDLPLGFDDNPLRGVGHETGQESLLGQTVDKGPEADALDNAADRYLPTLGGHRILQI